MSCSPRPGRPPRAARGRTALPRWTSRYARQSRNCDGLRLNSKKGAAWFALEESMPPAWKTGSSRFYGWGCAVIWAGPFSRTAAANLFVESVMKATVSANGTANLKMTVPASASSPRGPAPLSHRPHRRRRSPVQRHFARGRRQPGREFSHRPQSHAGTPAGSRRIALSTHLAVTPG